MEREVSFPLSQALPLFLSWAIQIQFTPPSPHLSVKFIIFFCLILFLPNHRGVRPIIINYITFFGGGGVSVHDQ